MTNAKRNYYIRLNAALDGILSTEGAIIAAKDPDGGALEEKGIIEQSDYVNIGEAANMRVLPLGTNNFGRDVLTELVTATGVSLLIGFVAGSIATLIGLTLGLLAGYVGGLMDDTIMFFTNLFTVIPTIVLLILFEVFMVAGLRIKQQGFPRPWQSQRRRRPPRQPAHSGRRVAPTRPAVFRPAWRRWRPSGARAQWKIR